MDRPIKYIRSDKLIAEIESRMEDCKLPDGRFPTTTNIVRYEELSCLRNYITSLLQEQPEVDIEKEAIKFVQSKEFIESEESPILLIARHSYELGLNAKKEE